jgi:hypothetical protein
LRLIIFTPLDSTRKAKILQIKNPAGFMTLKRIFYITALIAIFTRCAQVAPLTGGDRDLAPPKLLEAKPANASLNFTGNIIELKFDEFVQVNDIANQVIITPQTKELPQIEARGKKIRIEFNEALKTNTTYRIFFGNAISDMHERNTLNNLEYVFSTGAHIDSLRLEGKIDNAFDLKREKDVTVGLYDENESDSAVFNKKPLYLTRTGPDGRFKMGYLPESKYKLFAFTDKNKNLLYDGGEEQVAFNDELVEIPKDSVADLKLFKEEARKSFVKRSNSFLYGQATILYNKDIFSKVKAYNKKQDDLIRSDPGKNDTVIVYYHNIYDTLKILVEHNKEKHTDTLKISIMSKASVDRYIKDKRLGYSIDLHPAETGKLAFFEKPVLVFGRWMDFSKTDTSKVHLTSKEDSLVGKIVLREVDFNRLVIGNKLQQATEYNLALNKGAFMDKDGIESDSMVVTFKTTAKEDYSILNLKLIFPQKENHIVQLVNSNGAVIAEQYVESSIAGSLEKTLQFVDLIPGEYFVKTIEDKNKNKIWDTGSLMLKKQPETIYFNKQAIKLLADWEADIEWKIDSN